MDNVYLSGMIGAGKTTLGERLAARLGRPFVDLDREMDAALGRPFHELVEEQGWLAFRQLEYHICKRLAALDRSVCALGGGSVRYEWNTDVLHGTGLIVLLEADLPLLAARVRPVDRPRVHPGMSLEEDLARIWRESAHLYHRAADLAYAMRPGRDPEDDVEALLQLLQARGIV